MGYGIFCDEEEQRPLTTADIRALLDEQDARHKGEIRLQEERISAQQEEIRAYKEEIRGLVEEATDGRFKRINDAHQDEIRALVEEAIDKRFQDLERALAPSSKPLDTETDIFTDHSQRSSNTQLTKNTERLPLSSLLFQNLFQSKKRNEGGNNDNSGEDGDSSEGLEEDTFSMMMMNKPFREILHCHQVLVKIIFVVGVLGSMILFADTYTKIDTLFDALAFQHPVLYWSLVATCWVMMSGPLSGPWQFSLFTFLFLQFLLGFMIIFDQTYIRSFALGCGNGEACDHFNVPTGTWQGMTFAQYLAVFFALATQNDIFSSLQTLSKLRNTDNVPWDEVIGLKGNRTWRLWVSRILLPNALKFIQAVIILYATFVVIIQSTTIVDLLTDFTALFVISEADNVMFRIANQGYFGEDLMRKTEEVKAVRWMIMEEDSREEGDVNEDEEGKPRHWRNCNMDSCAFFTLTMIMIGGLTYFVEGQYNGRFMKMKHPKCDVPRSYLIGNQNCHDFPPYNTAECGWDGGDCPEPTDVEGYINCTVPFPNKIGNGVCEDWPPYNTEYCGFDGMDCIYDKVVVDGSPDCFVRRPDFIGDGFCLDFAPYNTPECGYDGGDCDPPQ